MTDKLLNSKIRKSITEGYPMYFIRSGLHGLELRAVSYTYENGNEKTRNLMNSKSQLKKIFSVQLASISNCVNAFQLF